MRDEEKTRAQLIEELAEIRQRLKSLQENKEILSVTQEIAQVGYWIWDVTTNELYWSDEFFRILGLEPQSVQPKPEIYWDMIHADDLQRERAASRKALALYGEIYETEHRIVRPDGTPFGWCIHEEK